MPDQVMLPKAIRAAEYVRMSTEGQQYSIANQQAAIREYALPRGIEIVRTYADPRKSGLRLTIRAHGSVMAVRSLKDVDHFVRHIPARLLKKKTGK